MIFSSFSLLRGLTLVAACVVAGCSSAPYVIQSYDADGEPVAFKRYALHESRDFLHHFGKGVYVKTKKPLFIVSAPIEEGNYLKGEGDSGSCGGCGEKGDAASCDMEKPGEKTAGVEGGGMETGGEGTCGKKSGGLLGSIFKLSKLSEHQRALVAKHGDPDYVRPAYKSRSGERIREWLYMRENLHFQFVEGVLVYSGSLMDREMTLLKFGYPRSILWMDGLEGVSLQTFSYRNWLGTEMALYSFADDKLFFSLE